MSSYIKSSDTDYNLGIKDFTIEFFSDPSSNSNCQTILEISNDKSFAANLFSYNRFFINLINGNIISESVYINDIFYVDGNISTFSTSNILNSNNSIFYDENLLTSNQYTTSENNITLLIPPSGIANTKVEVGTILFQITGNNLPINQPTFISSERKDNNFYLFVNGISQQIPNSNIVYIPSSNISNIYANTTLDRTNFPALLTIGSNKDGGNPYHGKLGNFKITKNIAKHVISPNEILYSNFQDQLGTKSYNIDISGQNFLKERNSDELAKFDSYDSLFFQVYQSDNSNLNSNILSFALFKPSIELGPVTNFSSNVYSPVNINSLTCNVPWATLDKSEASIKVNNPSITELNNYIVPSTDWNISMNSLKINFAFSVSGNSNIQVTATSPTYYYDINANSVSILESNLYATDDIIYVSNTDPFITPILGDTSNAANVFSLLNVRGQVFVNQECITYLYIDRTLNTLSGLQRGSSGTETPNIHLSGSRIINFSYNQDLQYLANADPRISSWYTYPLANTSLQNTNSAISSILVEYGGLPPIS